MRDEADKIAFWALEDSNRIHAAHEDALLQRNEELEAKLAAAPHAERCRSRRGVGDWLAPCNCWKAESRVDNSDEQPW